MGQREVATVVVCVLVALSSIALGRLLRPRGAQQRETLSSRATRYNLYFGGIGLLIGVVWYIVNAI